MPGNCDPSEIYKKLLKFDTTKLKCPFLADNNEVKCNELKLSLLYVCSNEGHYNDNDALNLKIFSAIRLFMLQKCFVTVAYLSFALSACGMFFFGNVHNFVADGGKHLSAT